MFRSVRASPGGSLFFLMELELSETLKLSTIPVLPITSDLEVLKF